MKHRKGRERSANESNMIKEREREREREITGIGKVKLIKATQQISVGKTLTFNWTLPTRKGEREREREREF